MSHAFRELLRKVGSGTHTNEPLTRPEAAAAMRMMLNQEATPAQIGAFMIAHRIRRPTGEELAGMLDAYDELGVQLQAISAEPVLVMGIPYDGRTRTAALAPLTALVLAAAGCPVIQHGGSRMPTKEGDPLIGLWQGLGVDWAALALSQVQVLLEKTGLGFVYLPSHFPQADGLVPYRDQIGKRPPLATMELMWCPYAGKAHVVSGFVHPPTETILFQPAFALRGVQHYTTVKGLEGSCDLPRERTVIVGLGDNGQFERLHLHPREFGLEGKNVPFVALPEMVTLMHAVLDGQPSELQRSLLWNSGFYLWRSGLAASVQTGIEQADQLLTQGTVKQKLHDLQQAITPVAV
jgi:anthranilate phosphoribosyltransferase